MSVFEPIELQWNGETYTIPADKVMGAITRIEEHVTFPELQRYEERGGMPLAKCSMAFASVLRYAGCRVSDDEVYAGIFQGEQTQQIILDAILNLMMMMIPPGALEEDEPQQAPLFEAGMKKKPANKSSKRSSGKAG